MEKYETRSPEKMEFIKVKQVNDKEIGGYLANTLHNELLVIVMNGRIPCLLRSRTLCSVNKRRLGQCFK